jgi:hypothetical protein
MKTNTIAPNGMVNLGHEQYIFGCVFIEFIMKNADRVLCGQG